MVWVRRDAHGRCGRVCATPRERCWWSRSWRERSSRLPTPRIGERTEGNTREFGPDKRGAWCSAPASSPPVAHHVQRAAWRLAQQKPPCGAITELLGQVCAETDAESPHLLLELGRVGTVEVPDDGGRFIRERLPDTE